MSEELQEIPEDMSLQEQVIKEFSSDSVQKTYEEATKQGLWPSEKILYTTYFKKNSSVLDIGCGAGRTTFPLVEIGHKVVGVDITPAMIKTAKKLSKELKIKAEFQEGDATKLPFKDQSFDNALFSFNGWCQVPGSDNRLRVLEQVFRVIKPGGRFIFSSHIRHFVSFRMFFWIWQWMKLHIFKPLNFPIREQEYGDRFFKRGKSGEFENEQFIHIPSLKEVKTAIKDAGFTLEKNAYRLNISMEDDKVKAGNCMFFVCEKPL